MSFIQSNDYDATIHAEILTAITRNNPDVIADCEETAIEDVKGYLSSRYDVDEIFSQTGSNRHKIIIQYVKDIAVYRMHIAHNPVKMPESRVVIYEQTVKALENIQKGRINPVGLPLLPGENNSNTNYIKFGSNTKRSNHF
jgi:phage gp36-like protein